MDGGTERRRKVKKIPRPLDRAAGEWLEKSTYDGGGGCEESRM